MKKRFEEINFIPKINRCIGMKSAFTSLGNALLFCAVYFYVGWIALTGMIGIGEIVKYAGSVATLIGSISRLVNLLVSLKNNGSYLEVLFQFLNLQCISEAGENEDVGRFEQGKTCVEIENLSFRYRGSDRDALRNINLRLKYGKRYAVVGMNGSGKTTLIKLILRLYKPLSGTICMNRMNVDTISINKYRKQFSVVFQDFKLYAFSVGENIAVSLHYDQARVERALEEAGAWDMVRNMPDKMETILYHDYDPNGEDISGGEAQKLSLGRALHKNAPILILDEPSAALDPMAEFQFYKSLDKIANTRLTIFTSHRLSSCRFCDEIIVLHEGEIVQIGTHETLLADETGIYHKLWQAQAVYYQDGATVAQTTNFCG